MFCVQDLRANCGQLEFPGLSESRPFLVCSDKTTPALLANFFAHGPWKLGKPDLVINVNGGARDFTLEPKGLLRLLTKGIADAAETTRAVITTAGTDAGVSKLLAAGLKELGVKRPVIGIAPFRKVRGHELLSVTSEVHSEGGG